MTFPNTAQPTFLTPESGEWMEALQKVPHDLFHLPGYLQVSAAHEGGSPVAVHLEADGCGMLMPILLRPLEEFGPAFADCFDASSPYGYPSPLFWGEGHEALIPGMLEACWTFLREQRVVALFLRMNPFLESGIEALASQSDLRAHGPTVYLDLTDPEASWMGINAANRGFITRTYKHGHHVTLDDWTTYDAVIEAYYETMTRLEATPFYFFPKSYFHGLREATAPHLHLATALSPTGEVTGGVLFSEVGGLIQYFLTGSFDAFREVSPAKILIDTLRTWGIQHGHHTVNLGGGVGANQDGLFTFKSRFSKHFKTFKTLRKILLPEVYASLTASRGILPDPDEAFFPAYRKPI